MSLTFLSDEDIDVAVVRYLRRRGHQVVEARAEFGEQSVDRENMAWAKAHGAIYLTGDKRFVNDRRFEHKRSAVLLLDALDVHQRERVKELIDNIEQEAAARGEQFFMRIALREFTIVR